MKAPIAVMSFNRPAFLAETLDSLKAQQGGVEDREFHLFQDGAVNRWSRMRYASEQDIEACIEMFRAAFPNGTVHYTGDNIGIFENFCRAEAYFFEENAFDTAWFFEDDMVLSPVYFLMMERLQAWAARSSRVAYFSAYGNYYASPSEVAENRRAIIPLDHHWAFGLRRAAWLKMQPMLAGYFEHVRGQDYARRYHRGIFEYFAKSGLVPRGSSQDAAKMWTCARLGLLRLRTFAPFARYIGTKGAHMTKERFDELGFANTVLEETEITDLKFPDDDAMTEMLDEQRNLLLSIYRIELPDIMRELPAKKYNPMRKVTAEDVIAAYRLLLNRNPEIGVVEGHVDKTAAYTLVRGLIRSSEFQSALDPKADRKTQLDPKRICSEEELFQVYNLLLHRDPDGPAVEQRAPRNRTAWQVLIDLIESAEFDEQANRIQHPW